jgi:hypothetical protein
MFLPVESDNLHHARLDSRCAIREPKHGATAVTEEGLLTIKFREVGSKDDRTARSKDGQLAPHHHAGAC